MSTEERVTARAALPGPDPQVAPVDPDMLYTADDLLCLVHQRVTWLTAEWAPTVDAQLHRLDLDGYDTADRVNLVMALIVVNTLVMVGFTAITIVAMVRWTG